MTATLRIWPEARPATRLMTADLGVRADVVQRARQDRDEHGARVRAADRGAVVPALAGGDGADDEPDCQDDGAESHQFLTSSPVRPWRDVQIKAQAARVR